MYWQEIISFITGGALFTLLTLGARVRKEKVAVKMSEVDLKKAELNVEEMLDAAQKEQMEQLISELKTLRAERAEFLKQQIEFEKRQTELELKVVEVTRRALLAEQRYESSRCDNLTCLKRVPPFNTEKDDKR